MLKWLICLRKLKIVLDLFVPKKRRLHAFSALRQFFVSAFFLSKLLDAGTQS